MDLPLKKTFMPEKKPIIIANWKMKLGIVESKKLALEKSAERLHGKELSQVLAPNL